MRSEQSHHRKCTNAHFPIPCRIHLFPLRLTAGMVMGVCLVAGAGNL